MDHRANEEPEVEEPLVDENGVDLTLIRYALSLTPTERLKGLENYMNVMATVRVVRRSTSEAP